MARPKKVIRTLSRKVSLPEDLVAKMDLELFSDLEGKIPHGAYQEFFTSLLQKYFQDLEEFRTDLAAQASGDLFEDIPQ